MYQSEQSSMIRMMGQLNLGKLMNVNSLTFHFF